MSTKQAQKEKAVQVLWDGDKLNRKKTAEVFTRLLYPDQKITISLNSSYGTGKTFFVEKWQEQLNFDGYTTLFFNAWETDFSGDPFIAFATTVYRQIAERKTQYRAILDKAGFGLIATFIAAKDLIWAAAPEAASVAVAAAGASPEEASTVKKTVAAVRELIPETAQKIKAYKERLEANNLSLDALRNHREIEDAIFTFKQALHALGEKIKEDTKKPVVVFIDELDRCRPTFAIELLEIVKHIFSIKNFVFIVCTDRKQLESSIKAVYGSEFDSQEYLKRFFDYELTFPQHRDYREFINNLYDRHLRNTGVADDDSEDIYKGGKALVNTLALVARALNLSMRQIERVFTAIDIAIKFNKSEQGCFYPYVFPIIATLKVLEGQNSFNRDNLIAINKTYKSSDNYDIFSGIFSLIKKDMSDWEKKTLNEIQVVACLDTCSMDFVYRRQNSYAQASNHEGHENLERVKVHRDANIYKIYPINRNSITQPGGPAIGQVIKMLEFGATYSEKT